MKNKEKIDPLRAVSSSAWVEYLTRAAALVAGLELAELGGRVVLRSALLF